jgi:hypothetical protein
MVRLMIATPLPGGSPEACQVSLGYSVCLNQLAKDPDISVNFNGHGTDLVRSRSRLVRQALEKKDISHVLWWDSDVMPRKPNEILPLIKFMLSTDHDIVACPYPQKRVHWDAASETAREGVNAEWGAYNYAVSPIKLPEGERPKFVKGCTEVTHIGMGFMLCKTSALQKMWDAYYEELKFDDLWEGTWYETVAMFQLIIEKNPAGQLSPLRGEDYSFCERARRLGIKIQMYVGPHSPLDHLGTHVFHGHREGLVSQ